MERLSCNPFCGILNSEVKKLWNSKLNSSGKLVLEGMGLSVWTPVNCVSTPLHGWLPLWFSTPRTGSLYLPEGAAPPGRAAHGRGTSGQSP